MSLPNTRSAHTRRDTILLALLIIGLLIVFREVPVVHSFWMFLGALFGVIVAIGEYIDRLKSPR